MAGNIISLCMAVLLATFMAIASATPGAAVDDGTCLDSRAVQSLIETHKIKTWPAIKALAGVSDAYKEVSAVRVCQQNGQLYYVVNVAGPSGESKQLVRNAITGSK